MGGAPSIDPIEPPEPRKPPEEAAAFVSRTDKKSVKKRASGTSLRMDAPSAGSGTSVPK